ncbi:hypothetical protein AB0953_22465 [Streptomyces sp. NPDC046866]|uniref:hypothetical protein n=1 Tax=Streptomyces sp. NPDC046866 TaxID=3154921 RepID=UPI003456EC2B
MVKIEASRLAAAFLALHRGNSPEARNAAAALRPYTERPGQRVPVPPATLLRAGRALRQQARAAAAPQGRDRLVREADFLVGACGGLPVRF